MTKLLDRIRRANLETLLFLIFSTAVAMAMRLCLFDHQSWDYHQFLHPWFENMQENGGLLAVGTKIGDYMPPYFYILGLLTYLPIPDLYSIKLASCLADLLLAIVVWKLVTLEHSEGWGAAAYAAALFLPDVFLNSSAWGQCDAIFTTAMLWCVYYLIQKRPNRAVAAFSIAFVFKLQAIFLAPLLLLYVLKRRIRLRSALIFPAVYLLSVLPAAILGRNIWELLTVYVAQAGQYKQLCMSIPNLYSFLESSTDALLSKAGIYFAGGVVLTALYLLLRRKFVFTVSTQLHLALFFVLLTPFVLPHMHERYYYPAAVFSLVYGFCCIKRLWVTLAVCASSTYAICIYLYGVSNAYLPHFTLLLTGVLAFLAWDFYRQTQPCPTHTTPAAIEPAVQ